MLKQSQKDKELVFITRRQVSSSDDSRKGTCIEFLCLKLIL